MYYINNLVFIKAKVNMYEILKHLIITEVVEIGVAFLLGVREKKNIILIFIINMITNIPLNVILIYIVSNQVLYLSGYTGISIFVWYNIIVAFFEIIILFVEANFYYKRIIFNNNCFFYKYKNNFSIYFFMSFILNISSIIIGRVIT